MIIAMLIFILKQPQPQKEFRVIDHKQETTPVSSKPESRDAKAKVFSSSRLCPWKLGVTDLYWGIDSSPFYMRPLGVTSIRQ